MPGGSHVARTRHRRDVNTIARLDMEHLDTFLARNPPFDALAPAELAELAEHATQLEFETGASALVEDGRPTPGGFVILAGAMDIVHDGEVIEVLEPGECFGHPSLLTRMAPAFTVRAREPSRCALFPEAQALQVLGTEAGSRYVATTMRTRLTRAGHTVHGLLDVGTTPVSAIMRAPIFCAPDAPLREALRELDSEPGSALLLG